MGWGIENLYVDLNLDLEHKSVLLVEEKFEMRRGELLEVIPEEVSNAKV